MENEKKKVEIDKIREARNSVVYYLRFKEFRFLVISIMILGYFDFLATSIGFVMFISIFFLSKQMVIKNSTLNRFATYLLFIGLIVVLGDFFLKPDESISGITLAVLIVSIVSALSFVVSKMVISKGDMETSKKEIVNARELIRLCLKSENFDFLLILVFWFFFFIAAFHKMMIISTMGAMYGVVILFAYVLAVTIAFSLMFFGMLLVTGDSKKSFSSMLSFSVMTIIILGAFFFLSSFFVVSYLAPSFGV
ncbi:MAG: hypothetical protein WC178_05630 [Candidatus Paceibacterota bacterium]